MSVSRDRLQIYTRPGLRVCLDLDDDGLWHVVREQKTGKRWKIIDFVLADKADADATYAAWTREDPER